MKTFSAWWLRMTTVLLLGMASCIADTVCAASVKYIIINNKGKQAFNYTLNSSTLGVDPKAESIYAENFRFYSSQEDAQTDASTNGVSKPNVLTLGATATDGATYYVRYDAKSTRVGSDGSTKYLIRARNRNGAWWYIYFDNTDGNKLKMTTSLSEISSNLNKYLWQFNDGGDPYDVYITSDYADATVSGGTVSLSGVGTSNKTPYVTYQTKVADENYNQSATSAFTLQSFFFTRGTNAPPFNYGGGWSSIWSNSVHLVGAYNGISYGYRNGYNSGWENVMPYYLCANGDPSKSGAMSIGFQWHGFRTWRAEDTSKSNVSQIQVVDNFVVYHVVNKSGNIAISKMVESPASLAIPSVLKTPYITDDANYKYFNTKEQAAAYTANGTTTGAITDLASVSNFNVFVGYYWDGTVPSGLPSLNGSTWHQMKSDSNNKYITTSGSSLTGTTNTAAEGEEFKYLWNFTGNDPYDIKMSNLGTNEFNGATYQLANGNANKNYDKTYGWYNLVMTTESGLSVMIVNSPTANRYNIISLSPDGGLGSENYIRAFWSNSNEIWNTRLETDYNGNDARYRFQFPSVPIARFNFHVTTHVSNKELTASQIVANYSSTNISIADDLGRKYCSYTYHPTQEDANNGTNALTTYGDAVAHCTSTDEVYQVYVKYNTTSLPFDVSTDYDHARWYRMTATVGETTVWTHLSNNQLVAGVDDTYSHDYQYAFFGDPYELKVMNREAGNGRYMGVPAGSALNTAISQQTDGNINVWEIMPESVDGSFMLRAFGTAADPRYAGYTPNSAKYINTSAMKLTPVALPQYTYTYKIVDKQGRIAISASIVQDINTPIIFDNLPASIASPYIKNETITGYLNAVEQPGSSDGRKTYQLNDIVSETPLSNATIYIEYTTDHILDNTNFLHLRGARAFNLQVNGRYLYDGGAENVTDDHAVSAESTDANLSDNNRLWYLEGGDPYAVEIRNASTQNYIRVTDGHEVGLHNSPPTGRYFIIMGGSSAGDGTTYTQIELMAADGSDVDTDFYTLGYNSGVTMVNKDGRTADRSLVQAKVYVHALTINYYLIDKAGKLIEGPIASSSAELYLPDSWRSPLVTEYHYYGTPGLDGDTYSPSDELESPADVGEGGNVYVTYDVGNFGFDTNMADERGTTMYLLKYRNGVMFNQEDGSDGIMTNQQKAVYPYSNGDSNLYVYGQEQWEKQLSSGATTRTRWPWYIKSENRDPYHVIIMSYQEQGKSTSHNYLRTFAQTYTKTDGTTETEILTGVTTKGDRVVTGGVIDGVDYGTHHESPTEYMILTGPTGNCVLVTVDKIPLDLNDDGDTSDEGENERRTVTSFEQYWKNNPTVRNILNKAGKGMGSAAVTASLTAAQMAELPSTWHTYESWANGAPWSDTSTGGKDYLWGNHWFQTIDMGDGEFSFEEISLDPQLVLIDKHGWEIMRKPLPKRSDSEAVKAEKLAAIGLYDSPMVEKYHWWTSGSKLPGYHKYLVSSPQITVYKPNGTKWAVDNDATVATNNADFMHSTSLTDIPYDHVEITPGGTAKNFDDNMTDLYVTYDVKAEFADSYEGAATEAATRASAFLVKQNGAFAQTTNGTSITTTSLSSFNDITGNMLWYLRPNFNIDTEMGYQYNGVYDEKSQSETEADNYSEGRNGFDPYNLQIQSFAYTNRYVAVNSTAASLDGNGGWVSTGITGATLGAPTSKFHATGHDQTTLNITNTTFMAVKDANGNMRLMPRFDHSKVTSGLVSGGVTVAASSTTAETANDGTQPLTVALKRPVTYTYHIINKNGREALTYTDKYWTSVAYSPNLPTHLRAFATSNFKYLPLSEFYPDYLARGIYKLVSSNPTSRSVIASVGRNTDIYVIYDVDAAQIKNKGLNGTTIFNVKLRNTSSPVVDQYLSYVTASGTATAANTSLTADQKKQLENVWRIETTSSDPYEAKIYSFKNANTPLGVNTLGDSPTTAGNQTYETFIVTDWDYANNKFELLAANSGTTDNIYAYLTYSSGAKVLRSSTRQHNETVASNLVGLTIEPVALSFTYKLYDLAGNLTLQGSSDEVSDLTPSLPDFMKSPLVADYYYWKDEARSIPLTTLSNTEDNTVYVTYQALNPSDAPIKLDGSEYYTLFAKVNPERIYCREGNSFIASQNQLKYRPEQYMLQFTGNNIMDQFDPYSVTISIPVSNQYWSCNITELNSATGISLQTYADPDRFMILKGTEEGYYQIAHKKYKRGTYYSDYTNKIAYLTRDLNTRQKNQGGYDPDDDDNIKYRQMCIQPAYKYHIINLSGTEAVTCINGIMAVKGETEPQLPPLFKSPLISKFKYFDKTAFVLTEDGKMDLKPNAQELEYIADATSPDIYVVYYKEDILKTIDLTGATGYNMAFEPTRQYTAYWNEDAEHPNTTNYNRNTINQILCKRAGTDSETPEPEKRLDTSLLDTDYHYIWLFKGSDPYNIKLYNAADPNAYALNTDDGASNYQRTIYARESGTVNTLMLLPSGAEAASEAYTNGFKYRLMWTYLETGDVVRYMYMGKNYRYSEGYGGSKTDGSMEIVKCNYNDGWGDAVQYPSGTFAYLKLTPQNESDFTYKIVNKNNNIAIEYKVHGTTGIAPELPPAIRSPYAKNFQYWSDASCTIKKTTTTADAIIYVTYDADEEALADADIDLTASVSYNIWVNGMYLYNSSGSLVADKAPSRYDDTVHEWYLKGNSSGSIDPYDVRLKSKKDGTKFIELASYDNALETQSFSLVADNSSNEVQSFILMNGHPGRWELLAATKDETIVSDNNRLAYLGYLTNAQLLGVGSDDLNPKYQSDMDQVQVILRQPLSGVTYHIMNLSGTEAVRYTVESAKGDVLEVPEQIRSPFATNWKYWSDEACTAALTEVPDAYADIYVTYTYDDNTYSKLQIDGSRFYNMKVADKYIEEDEGAINALSESTFTVADANVTANLWAFNGTTSAGVDPYAMHLVNKAYTDVYAGAALSYVSDTETTMQMSDGETEDFRSTFFLVGNSAEGPYEMVLASGANITDNVLAYVNRHSDDEVNLNRDNTYTHGNSALQIELTSPTNKYLYKVYDRNGNLAIQAWGDGVAGAAPVIPATIKSPLVSTYYYDVETLPHTTGVDEVAVTYDFDASKLTSPNLLGTKLYNLKIRGGHFLKTTSGSDVTQETDNAATNKTEGGALSESTEDIYIWKPTGQFGGDGVEDIDPYCITLKHSNGKVLTAESITLGNNSITLADDNAANTYQRFILVEGYDGHYELIAATGDEIGSTYGTNGYDMLAYLAVTDGNEVKLSRGEAYGHGKTSVQADLVPFQYTSRFVIINNDMYEAITYDVLQDGGDPVQIPDGLRSPLLNLSEYQYYKAAAFSTIGSFEHPDGSASTPFEFADVDTKTANKLTIQPYEGLTIYVRYSYSPKSGGLDLTGISKYLIMNENSSSQFLISASTSENDHRVWNNSNPTNRTENYYQWRLRGEDPYNLKITNVARDNFNDALQSPELWYRNGGEGSNYTSREQQGFEMRTDNYASNATTNGKYKANRFAILGHEDGNYRLMAITPFFWHSDYYDLSDTQRNAGGNNLKQERYYTIDNTWNLHRHNRNNYTDLLDMEIGDGISIQFLPTTTHNYRFHLTTKIDGRKLVVEKPNVMARDIFAIPEELLRKYCDYTVTYYVDQDNDEATQLPVTIDAATKVRKTIDLTSGTELYPFFQAIDNMSDGDKANTWVDIYIDYHARQHYKTDADDNYIQEGGKYVIDEDGMPFNVMGWNASTVHMLLNNTGGYTDYLFQINNYENLNETLGTFGLHRYDYLYFMVLKTNDDYTNNNGQYFLRREETGRISYLNNDYTIHKDAEKNYKGWNYSRMAEAYRENDHSVFEEKKWLWCFAGDPYDFYIFNANSTVEETYNDITEQKEFVKTHRNHLVTYKLLTNTAGTTSEYVVNTPLYSDTESTYYRWGLAEGQGANSSSTFSLITGEFEDAGSSTYNNPTIPNEDNKPLYWRMHRSTVENTNEVMLRPRTTDLTELDYNINVLPYKPNKYEELRFVIRRDDQIDDDGTTNTYLGKYPKSLGAMIATGDISSSEAATKSQEMSKFIDALSSGTVRMYTSVGDRMYCHDDVITLADLPIELQRKFCDYKFYIDDYRTEGAINPLGYCPVRGTVQTDSEGNIVYNELGKAMYNYYAVDEDGNIKYVGPPGNQTPQGSPPKTIYIKYTVTTDKFLKQLPTVEEVETMVSNNDHVYFMDFADPNMLKGGKLGYNTGHHAYFQSDVTYQSQIGRVYAPVLSEKMKWNGSKFVYDTSQPYNYCVYKSAENRMETVPERLKWYFVGDPYKLQVYNTEYAIRNNTNDANLCRFDPTETAFQFVVDCVHFRSPDPSFIDERKTLTYTDADGNAHEVDNGNYGRPYYQNFYWEVVPAASEDEEAFALRFRADNQLLGYRDVYYYLAHDGIRRTYREALSENPKAYGINLSYDSDNANNLKGKYKGYHTANDENCVIRLLHPTKVYFTAYKETTLGDPVVTEELSEYFGLGETLTEVPRHLQRKFVKYSNLEYQSNNSTTWHPASFDFTLTKDVAFNLENCSSIDPYHTISNGWVYKETDEDGDPTKCRASFKFRVTYEVDDETKDGIHLFTTPAEFANTELQPQWLDVTVGGNKWLFYDKMNQNSSNIENDTLRVSNYPTENYSDQEYEGWDIGMKGLHWAFVGDPYKFTMINRRRWEDLGSPRTAVTGSNFWLGTGYAQSTESENPWYNYVKFGDSDENRAYGVDGTGGNLGNGNTEWGLVMSKTGGDNDYFIRTSSLKVSSVDETVGDYTSIDPRNMTNNYQRLVYHNFTNNDGSANPLNSAFVLEEFSLETKTSAQDKAVIRTAVAKDDDNADNDCFDANVHIYDINGNLKATLKHVELKYGNVFESLPPTLKRFGCNYIECYQLYYNGYTGSETDAEKTAKTTAINNQLKSLNNFTGANKITIYQGETQNEFTGHLDASKLINTDSNGRKYYEIAYVYTVDEQYAQYFTSEDNAEQDEYYWTNAYYQWDQVYKGSNVRVTTYKDVFDHYEYNADGHIVNEVYRQVETEEYKSGENISAPAYGWVNTHDNSEQAFGDKSSRTNEQQQKWAFVGDPYDFEFKNYALYQDNENTALYYDTTNGIVNSNIQKSHWAIVQGLQKTAIVDGKTVKVYTDSSGNTVYTASSGGVENTPVYVYYLALIDDDETSETFGSPINFVTFDRASDNKDLPSEDQYLYLKGSLVSNDPTATLYSTDTKQVHPFYIAEVEDYANIVIYHLVIAHQHSLDYTDTDAMLGADATEQNANKLLIDQHLVEWLKYKYPEYMTTTSTTVGSTTYTKATETIDGANITGGSDFTITSGTTVANKLKTTVKDEIIEHLKQASLRDIVRDEIPDYTVTRVGIGNAITVPWYMKRQFCKYTLYQRDVLRSQTSDRIVYEDDGVTPKTFIDENGVEQIAKEIDWISVTDDPSKKYYEQVVAGNGKPITKLDVSHQNRMVIIDVVYDVDDSQFRFADEGRNTTAWYQLMTGNEDDGLVNFTYSGNVGARRDAAAHYTNNYLWAPVGDPYGFVMHNRYATVNGTGWDNVTLTTDNANYDDNESTPDLSWTDAFTKKNICQTTQIKHNAVYEMYAGMNKYTFLMHPTANTIGTTDDAFNGFYMTHNTTSHLAELKYAATASSIRSNREANWRLMVTPEQVLPYFERSGYVGGLKPAVAGTFANTELYNTLKTYKSSYRANPSVIDFKTIDGARKTVYAGTFYKHNGTELLANEAHPTGSELPLKFKSTNLVPLEKGYYRLQAFSTEALNTDGTSVNGIVGPRFVSGYRFESEKDYSKYADDAVDNDSPQSGYQYLHFFETDEANTTFHTFGALNTAISGLDAGTRKTERTLDAHPALRGNIEILPAEYDPSSIFYFEPLGDSYDRFRFGTQGLYVNGTAGVDDVGFTKLDASATPFQMSDIGGTAITIRTMATESASDENLANNLKTNYLCIDPNHRYRISLQTDNEMEEIGDELVHWNTEGLDYAIQNTKWLLKPVGTQTEWPYNEMALRVKVNKGGDSDANYYASNYVPFDTRLNKTIDAAFTSITPIATGTSTPTTIRLTSVSQLNEKSNPQFIPANWPVIIRTSKPERGMWKKWNSSTKAVVDDTENSNLRPYYVDLYIPNVTPTSLPESLRKIKLYGVYLEKTLAGNHATLASDVAENDIDKMIYTRTGETPTWTNGRNVMTFGLPFSEIGVKDTWNDNIIQAGSRMWYNYDTSKAVGFYTNENWWRGHIEYSSVESSTAFEDEVSDANKALQVHAHWSDARNATSLQRDNKYVYNNKAFYVYDWAAGSPTKDRPGIVVLFGDEEDDSDNSENNDESEDTDFNEDTDTSPWPCDVYDLQGRRVARNETPETLLKNNPGLPRGVYIFGHQKVFVK